MCLLWDFFVRLNTNSIFGALVGIALFIPKLFFIVCRWFSRYVFRDDSKRALLGTFTFVFKGTLLGELQAYVLPLAAARPGLQILPGLQFLSFTLINYFRLKLIISLKKHILWRNHTYHSLNSLCLRLFLISDLCINKHLSIWFDLYCNHVYF